MIKTGLTGNIGSGKTIVAKIFELLGVEIFYADNEAKILLDAPEVIQELKSVFGNKVKDNKDKIDRKKLAGIIFNDNVALKKVNKIIHPRVRQKYLSWLKHQKDMAYTIHEAAIMFESGFDKMFDQIIFVSAPEELRIKRIMKRDNSDRQSAVNRIRNQASEKEKIKKSDYVIINDDDNLIIPQILTIHRNLINLR